MDIKLATPIGGIKLGVNGPKPGMPGGITPIPGAEHNADIIELARWAVNEYNKEQGRALKYCKVECAASQVVSGVMYYITLEAIDGCLVGQYEAKVWEQAWLHSRKLEGFKQLQYNC